MKAFLTFLSTAAVHNGSPPCDGIKREVHPILKRGKKKQNTAADVDPLEVVLDATDDDATNVAAATNAAATNAAAATNVTADIDVAAAAAKNNARINNNNEVSGVSAPPSKETSPRSARRSIVNSGNSGNSGKEESRPAGTESAGVASQKENQSNNARMAHVVSTGKAARFARRSDRCGFNNITKFTIQ